MGRGEYQHATSTIRLGDAIPLSNVLGKEPVDEHAEHCGHEMHPPISLAPINGTDYNRALAAALLAGIKAAKIEIKQLTPGRAWAVMEIDRRLADAVALDPVGMAVV